MASLRTGALAREKREPILFKGDDFGHTDLRSALEPQSGGRAILGRMKSLLGVVLFASLSAGLVRGETEESRQDEICGKYANVPLPTEAQPAGSPAKWPDCESYKLYSGIGMAVDLAAARRCAWAERAASPAEAPSEKMIDNIVGGSVMLAIIYANGDGAEQDKPLALRLACDAGMESSALKAIEALPDEAHISEKKFSCHDAAYTTIEMNFCAAWDSEAAAQKRDVRLDAISAPWPRIQKEAFATLRKAAEEYVIAHGRGEIDQGGTIRGLRTNGVEERQRDKFLEAVQRFERGRLPKGTPSDYRKADAELNATYQKALDLATAHKDDYQGQIQPEGIQGAERAWLKYRNAWVAFAKTHYPNTDANAWLTLLTKNRVWSLRATMCHVGWDDPACKPR